MTARTRFAALCLSLVPLPALAQPINIVDISPDRTPFDAQDPAGASGGRINGLANVAGDRETFYAASEWGGLFKSIDGGNRWYHLDGHLPMATWDVEVDPSNPNRVFATSFYDGRVRSWAGISVSTDAGATWSTAELDRPARFCLSVAAQQEPFGFGIAIDPQATDNVYVGTQCGLAISNDAGVSWGVVDTTASNPANAVPIWDVVVHHGGIIDTCGRTWSGRVAPGLPLPAGGCSIAASPDEAYVLFAVVGDGFVDLAIGAPNEAPAEGPRSGHVFVFRGTSTGLRPWHGFGHSGLAVGAAGDRFGASLASGDFNNDGLDDLAVGAPGAAPIPGQSSGRVFIFVGDRRGLKAKQALDQSVGNLGRNEDGDSYGLSVASGDFDGDLWADLAVGAPNEIRDGRKGGYVFTYRGTDRGLVAWKGLDQEAGGLGHTEDGDNFGFSLAAGDFDRDHQDDLAVGAPGEKPAVDPERAGYVFVFRGSGLGLFPWQGLSQESGGLGINDQDDQFGYALAAGDLDGDGSDDLAVGVPFEKPGDQPRSGYVMTFRGGRNGQAPTPWQGVDQRLGRLGRNEDGDLFGAALAIGDFDGDGRDDLAVGAPGEAPGEDPESGWAFLYRVATADLVAWRSFGQNGLDSNEAGDQFGFALAVGDFTGDGREDLAVGAPGETTADQAKSGEVFTYKGTPATVAICRALDQES